MIREAQNINYFSEEEVNQETNIILNMVKGKSYTEMIVGTVGRDVPTPVGLDIEFPSVPGSIGLCRAV